MLKVIPVEEAVGLPLAHDITEIVPGKHKGPAFRRGHIVRQEDISKLTRCWQAQSLCDGTGKRRAARRGRRAPARHSRGRGKS